MIVIDDSGADYGGVDEGDVDVNYGGVDEGGMSGVDEVKK